MTFILTVIGPGGPYFQTKLFDLNNEKVALVAREYQQKLNSDTGAIFQNEETGLTVVAPYHITKDSVVQITAETKVQPVVLKPTVGRA